MFLGAQTMMVEDAECDTTKSAVLRNELSQGEHRTKAGKNLDNSNSISRGSPMNESMPSVRKGNKEGDDPRRFTWERKRHMVQRVKTCEGPLECHALQGCMQSYVSICAAYACRGDRPAWVHLEEWLRAILNGILDCLGQGREHPTPAVGELRSATFLLQLCSTILKSQRGESHPERAGAPFPPQVDGASIADREDSSKCHEGDRLAAQACAELATPYLGKMVRVASVLMLEDLSGNSFPGCTGGCHGGADAVFWVLSLLSDVLKHLRKREWGCRVSVAPSSRKSGSDDETKAMGVSREASKAVSAAGSEGSGSTNAWGVSDEVVPNALGLADLVEAFSAVPVGRRLGTPDVALKWLEVAQLLMDAAEARWHDTLPALFALIPAALWRLTDGKGSLLPRQQSARPPGSSFVEEDGADDALSQASLTIIFRIVRVCGERGLFGVQDRDNKMLGRNKNTAEHPGKGAVAVGHERMGQPWSTVVDALVASAADTMCTSADGPGSHLVFSRRLVRLFCDQDDALVDMLSTNLDVFLHARPQERSGGCHLSWRVSCIRMYSDDGRALLELNPISPAVRLSQEAPVGDDQPSGGMAQRFPPALQALYGGQLHPATLFAALLSEVRFDPGVLLDWLISPETKFLRYLTLLLRVAVAEWPEFAANVSGASLSTAGIDDSNGVLCGMEDEDKQEELVLSEEEAERLSSVASCLSGLVSIARGLERSGLVPYNVAPLLRRIEQVVLLYEDCGDAHEEGQDLREMSVDSSGEGYNDQDGDECGMVGSKADAPPVSRPS